MATYTSSQLGIKAPAGGFQQGGWYNGRQYWNGSFSDPGVIHPQSNQQGAGQAVSKEVNAQSAAQQGVSSQQLESYLQQQRQQPVAAPSAPAPAAPTGGTPKPASTSGGAGGSVSLPAAQPTINLPELYSKLYDTSGIMELEKQLNERTNQYTETKAASNDNPFLSEATRVGRIAKIDSLYNEQTANLRNEIAQKKADVETKLNLELKQFDINSQQAQQELQKFNTLLNMGALDGASGEDIANITRSTGLSSEIINSAISANKVKNTQTQVITSTNDAGVVTATVIDPTTGNIIKQTSLGSIGNKQTGGATKTSEADKQAYYTNSLREDASRGVELADIFKLYTGYLDPNIILQMYNANSMYGPATEDYYQLEKYGVKAPN